MPIGIPLPDLTSISSWTSKTAGRCEEDGFSDCAMRDGVWDRTASHQNEYRNTAPYDAMTVALRGTSPHSEAVLAFGAYGARGAIVTDLQ